VGVAVTVLACWSRLTESHRAAEATAARVPAVTEEGSPDPSRPPGAASRQSERTRPA